MTRDALRKSARAFSSGTSEVWKRDRSDYELRAARSKEWRTAQVEGVPGQRSDSGPKEWRAARVEGVAGGAGRRNGGYR